MNDGVVLHVLPDYIATVIVNDEIVQLNVTTAEEVQLVVNNGVPGPVGPTGAPGGITDYQHIQSVAAATWTIPHNLGRKPTVTLFDVGGNVFIASIQHLSANTCVVYNAVAIAGSALCI